MRGHHHDLRPLGRRHRLRQLADQLEPGHAGHQVVDDEQVEAALTEVTLRIAHARGLDDLVPFVAQRAAEPLEDLLLVVDEQDVSARGRRHACGLRAAPAAARSGFACLRRGGSCTTSVPPSPSMMFFEIGRPSPVPARRVVKYGSKICAMSSGDDADATVLNGDGHVSACKPRAHLDGCGVRGCQEPPGGVAAAVGPGAGQRDRVHRVARVGQQVDQGRPQPFGVGVAGAEWRRRGRAAPGRPARRPTPPPPTRGRCR